MLLWRRAATTSYRDRGLAPTQHPQPPEIARDEFPDGSS
jgi:hypothetical protein